VDESDSRGGLFLRRGLGGSLGEFELGEKLGGIFSKFIDAELAAENHGAVRFARLLVNVFDGFAHAAEFFASHDAGFQWVSGLQK
jgi:hypothetical protein